VNCFCVSQWGRVRFLCPVCTVEKDVKLDMRVSFHLTVEGTKPLRIQASILCFPKFYTILASFQATVWPVWAFKRFKLGCCHSTCINAWHLSACSAKQTLAVPVLRPAQPSKLPVLANPSLCQWRGHHQGSVKHFIYNNHDLEFKINMIIVSA
jgi:hypothetical protein